jgi:hypothetical protein
MNWGVRIAIFYIGFVLIVLASVFFAMNQKIDLVTENYYEKELKHQEQIDRQKRTGELKEKTEIKLEGKNIKIKFPSLPDGGNVKNSILLYRPSDKTKDVKIGISTDTSGVQMLPSENLVSGLWRIKLNWVSKGEEYYSEEMVNIP